MKFVKLVFISDERCVSSAYNQAGNNRSCEIMLQQTRSAEGQASS